MTGIETRAFDEGLMTVRHASLHEQPVAEIDRRFRRRPPDDHPGRCEFDV